MAMDAVVLLRVAGKVAAAAVEAHLASPAGKAQKDKGVVATTIEGGCLLYVRMPFSSEPFEILAAVKRLLGKSIDQHKEKRGVYVFPELGRGGFGAYDDIIEELGELGYWAQWADVGKSKKTEAQPNPAANFSFPGVDPGLMQNLAAAAMSNDPDEMGRLGAQFGDLLAKQAGLGDLADLIRKAATSAQTDQALANEFDDDSDDDEEG
jgi:hypothetical protein